jgi:hypothetical protein
MKLLINGMIVASAIGLGIYVTRGSWRTYARLSAEADMHTKQMNDAEKARLKKLDDASRADTSIGREERARGDGYLGQHEVAVDAK